MKCEDKNACLRISGFVLAAALSLSCGKAFARGSDPDTENGIPLPVIPQLLAAESTQPGAALLVWITGLETAAADGSTRNASAGGSPDSCGSALSLSCLSGQVSLETGAGRVLCSGPLFMRGSGICGCILAVPCTAPAAGCRLVFRDALGFEPVPPRAITVRPRRFLSEDIKLDSKNTEIRSKPDPKKTAEAEKLWSIYLTTDALAVYLDRPFILPTGKSRRSANFNDQRRYLYSNGSTAASVHAGVDIAVPKGTRVCAAERGKVVFADMRIVTGNTVIIEHLPGVYSLYFHLSKIETREGAFVEQGDEIALSGMTGLATGPHLHWEMRVRGEAVDPDCMLPSDDWCPPPEVPGLVLSH